MPARLVCLCLLLTGAPALAKTHLVVQVSSNLRPAIDFHSIRTSVQRPKGDDFVARPEKVVLRTDPFDQAVRVAEIPLPDGVYRLTVSALNSKGEVLLERRGSIKLGGGEKVVTVQLSLPTAAPESRGACQQVWSRKKRHCDRLHAACLGDAKGVRTRMSGCQRGHLTCLNNAAGERDQCRGQVPPDPLKRVPKTIDRAIRR